LAKEGFCFIVETMVIDGRKIAEKILEETKVEFAKLKKLPFLAAVLVITAVSAGTVSALPGLSMDIAFALPVPSGDFGDTAKLTPLVKMYTLGHSFVPSAIHAGGLRYHGAAPILSLLVKRGIFEGKAYPQNPVFDAAMIFARTEGLLPAPETAHAIRYVIDEATSGKSRCIVFNYSGHGHFDLSAYDAYLDGKLEDFEHPEEHIEAALKALPKTA